MFYTEEDVLPAVRAAEELFGPAGTMMEGKNVQRNVVIGTDKFGKIWYGDVDGFMDIAQMLLILKTKIGQPAFVVPADQF